MRKRVFGSILLTALVTLLLTAALLLAAVFSGLTGDVRERLQSESNRLAALLDRGQTPSIEALGAGYADRITLIAADGTVLYDNQSDPAQMGNHADRPEVAQARQSGAGASERLSDTLDEMTYYHAVQLAGGEILRVGATADSAFGALSAASPWIVLIVLLALLVAAVLAGRLTQVFLGPILTLDLRDPLKNRAYDELSPVLHRMAAQNRQIELQMNELRRRQAEFDDVTAHMDEGLILFSAGGEIVFANRAARALFPADTASGSYLKLCRAPDYIRVVESALAGKSAHGTLERDGRIYALTASAADGGGQEHAAALFLEDVTASVAAEQQRQEFSANVSHELKTPLTSIMGVAEIMENGIVKPEDIGRFAGMVRQEAARLLSLIEDIIRLSRLDEGGAAQTFEPVELLSLSGTVRDRLLHKAAANDVTLAVSGTPVTVQGERRTLEQMIFNLADNAVCYNRPGGSVTVAVGTQNGTPYVRVTDTGIGIAAADRERVFERFYRVDKSHSKLTGGTGLGLSIVKHAAMLHHARLELQSEEGQGTEITVWFEQQA